MYQVYSLDLQGMLVGLQTCSTLSILYLRNAQDSEDREGAAPGLFENLHVEESLQTLHTSFA